ncbi:unnamed protein product [Clavelina lepadiformis]
MYGQPPPAGKPALTPKPTGAGRNWPPSNASNAAGFPKPSLNDNRTPPFKNNNFSKPAKPEGNSNPSFLHNRTPNENGSPSWAGKNQSDHGKKPNWRDRAPSNELKNSPLVKTDPPAEEEPVPPIRKSKLNKFENTAKDESSTPSWVRQRQQVQEDKPSSNWRDRTSSNEVRKPWEKPKPPEKPSVNSPNEVRKPWMKPPPSEKEEQNQSQFGRPKTLPTNTGSNENKPAWMQKKTPQDETPSKPVNTIADDLRSQLAAQFGEKRASVNSEQSPSRKASVKSWKSDSSHGNEEHGDKAEANSIATKRPSWINKNASPSVPRKDPPEPASSLPTGRRSFLNSHKPAVPAANIPDTTARSSNSSPRRRPIPSYIHSRQPPAKPGKPPNVILPGRRTHSRDSRPNPGAPALPVRDYQQTSLSGPPALPSRDLPTPPAPSVGASPKRAPSFLNQRKSEAQTPPIPCGLPIPPDILDRDFPKLPDRSTKQPPGLPARDNTAFPEPPAPVTLRTLPSLPPRAGPPMPSPMSPPRASDVYDDTESAPPPAPSMGHPPVLAPGMGHPPLPAPGMGHPPLEKTMSADEIPTWEDEDEEAIYDETPDDTGGAFPVNGQMQDTSPISKKASKEDKKKKKAEKKEKEIREKFKLPKEGEIVVESFGKVKLDSKGLWGTNNLTVHKNEDVEIIRMNDNPKSKWLIRNSEGHYGYVDSDNIDVNMDVLRHTMQGVRSSSGPPVPPPMTSHVVPEDDEAVYDETVPDDVYEEL